MRNGGGLYSGKVGLSRICAITTAMVLFLFTLCFGSWWAVGRSAGPESVATTLLANSEVRSGVAEKLINQFTSDADTDLVAIVNLKKNQLIEVVSNALASPEISAESKKIIDQVYGFYTGKSDKSVVKIQALVMPILKAMASIDPAFNIKEIDVSTIPPITLDNSGSAPNLAPIKSGLAVAVFILFILLVLSIFGLAKFSGSKNSFVAVIGWEFFSVGAALLTTYFVATAGVTSVAKSATDPLINSAAPIVAQTFLSMFKLEGALLLVVGVIGIITWVRTKEVRPAQ